jgi:hypothetical protein
MALKSILSPPPLPLSSSFLFSLPSKQIQWKMQDDVQHYTTEQEKKLIEDWEENFRGIACVSLRKLIFKPKYSRDVDKKNVERLKGIFTRQGCLRLSLSNYVLVIINEQDLKVALQCLRRTLKDLLNSTQDTPLKLTLPPNYMLKCLYSQHRILAALEILRPKEEWWIVDLYLLGLTLKAFLSYSRMSNIFPSSNEFGGNGRFKQGVFQLVQFCRRRNL